MMKTVIVLAAGVGSRLRPMTLKVPKSLVPVNGIPLLTRFLTQVKKSEVKAEIIVVAGHLSQQVMNLVSSIDSDIRIITNRDFAVTNNMESCRLALECWEGGSCVIVNADCVYDDKIVLDLMLSNESCIAIDSSQYCEENMKVSVKYNSITEISKTLPDQDNVHTSIDLYHFVESDIEKLIDIMQGYNQRADLQKWNEVAINDLVKVTKVNTLDFNGHRWMEIDDLLDLAKAEALFS